MKRRRVLREFGYFLFGVRREIAAVYLFVPGVGSLESINGRVQFEFVDDAPMRCPCILCGTFNRGCTSRARMTTGFQIPETFMSPIVIALMHPLRGLQFCVSELGNVYELWYPL